MYEEENMKAFGMTMALAAALLLSACGNSTAVSSQQAASVAEGKAEVAMAKSSEQNRQEIQLEAKGKHFTAIIERNELTKKLLDKVPTTLSMTPLGGDLIYGDDPISMPGGLVRGLKKGDLAYCQYGYFIIFTEDQKPDHNTGFIKVGEITSGKEDLSTIAGGADVTIK